MGVKEIGANKTRKDCTIHPDFKLNYPRSVVIYFNKKVSENLHSFVTYCDMTEIGKTSKE